MKGCREKRISMFCNDKPCEEGSITALSNTIQMCAQLKQVLRTKQTFHSNSSKRTGDFNLSSCPKCFAQILMGFEIIGRLRCQKESRQNFDTIMIRFMIHIIFSCLLFAVSELRLNQKSNIGTFSYNSVI